MENEVTVTNREAFLQVMEKLIERKATKVEIKLFHEIALQAVPRHVFWGCDSPVTDPERFIADVELPRPKYAPHIARDLAPVFYSYCLQHVPGAAN